MSTFKCKMCGGTLEIAEGKTVIECEYCGTQQTLPKLDDDKRANMYDRANHLRRNNEFDKAMGIYEQILNEDNTDAEAYWSLVLCRYGIEYVEDPSSHKRIPTINRVQFTSIFDDDNYKSALQYADSLQRTIYEKEAKEINEIQKNILAISQKEEPFDVFICYKESDNNGRRTADSVLAQDLYYQLIQEGFKVFFSRITLEDKLGSAYEPYIFAALNSAKVMVVLGTKPEHFNAVWVKNEWSRYLALIKQGQKKTLIPAYKDMDPYDLPEEFSHLQAQDMSKLGFMQDLIRGIKKIIDTQVFKNDTESTIRDNNTNIVSLLKRAFISLESGDFEKADNFCEQVLNQDAENAHAYLGKLMAELHIRKQDQLRECVDSFANSNNYQRLLRYADENLKTELSSCIEHINARNEKVRLDDTYSNAKNLALTAKTVGSVKGGARIFESVYCALKAAELFTSIGEYLDSVNLAKECNEFASAKMADAKKMQVLFNEYKAAIENEKKIETNKNECNKIISSLNEQYDTLIHLKENLQNIKDELLALDEKLQSVTLKLPALYDERNKFRIFGGKRKKTIEENIIALESEKKNINKKISSLKEKKQKYSYSTISEVDNAICEKLKQIEEAKKILEKLSCLSIRSSQTIRDEISDFETGKDVLIEYDKIVNIKKGSYITFGTFVSLAVEWLVLEVNDGKALIVTKNALDYMSYFTDILADFTWENCDIRKWLNNDFINDAFSEGEKQMILETTISADRSPYHQEVIQGCSTTDRVFLLSIMEVNKYFESVNAKKCKYIQYAGSNVDNYPCKWWLRTNFYENFPSVVCADGVIEADTRGSKNAVRPALWINLDLLKYESKFIVS